MVTGKRNHLLYKRQTRGIEVELDYNTDTERVSVLDQIASSKATHIECTPESVTAIGSGHGVTNNCCGVIHTAIKC